LSFPTSTFPGPATRPHSKLLAFLAMNASIAKAPPNPVHTDQTLLKLIC
jgi:hypothetical protein